MSDSWLNNKYRRLKGFGWAAGIGVTVAASAFFLPESTLRIVLMVLGLIAGVPWFFYLTVLSIWHWKYRYRGKRSELWGILLVVETSGWFKLIYLFRHILPDRYGEGRYAGDHVELEGGSDESQAPKST